MKQEINNFRHNSVSFKFSNGNTIDAIFGTGTYSDNYDMDEDQNIDFREAWTTFSKSSTVESMFNCSSKLAKKIYKKYGGSDSDLLNRIPIDDWLEIAILIKREKVN